MDRLAICKTCHFAFVPPAGTPTRAFCPRCGNEAATSDGTVAGFFALFNEVFPTATPRRARLQISKIAAEVAARQPTQSASSTATAVERDANALFWKLASMGMNALMLIITVLMYIQAQKAMESEDEYQATTTRMFEQFLNQFGHAIDVAPANAEQPRGSSDIRGRTQKPAPGETASAPKQKPRTGKPRKRRKSVS